MKRSRLLRARVPCAAVALLLATCLAPAQTSSAHRPARPAVAPSAAAKPAANAAPSLTQPADRAVAARWLRTMTLREKVAQLFVIGFSGHPMNTRSREYRKFVRLVAADRVGGLILVNVSNGRLVSKADPLEAASFINRMQRLARIPLLVSADFERGASMRLDSTTVFPHAMAFAASGDPDEARQEGAITAREARAVGVQWLFFPDADVNNNPDNPIINIRSYGENPADVAAFVSAFIEGAHSVPSARVLTTAKHFPGHGDTDTDTHLDLATIQADRPRLEAVEWTPFRAAIRAGVDSVMTAHIAVPSLDDAGLPATLSKRIIGGVLRDELGFRGIVVTDALDMGGIVHGYPGGQASVLALQAGADVLLMPAEPEAAIDAVVEAVRAGKIPLKRIEESDMRILTAKAHLGLGARRLVNVEEIPTVVDSPESNAVAQNIADRSVTLVRNQDGFVPLKQPGSTAFFSLVESPSSLEGIEFTTEVRKRLPGAKVATVDTRMSAADLQAAAARATDATSYVVAAFASVAAYRGNVALGGELPDFINSLIATKKPVALLALGNPYLLRSFPDVAAYMTTYSTVPPSELSAVKALFGEIAIGGKLPVTIPGLARYGEGIALPGPGKPADPPAK